MEIVSAIVDPVVQSLMVPVKQHIGYLISCTKYVDVMGTKMSDLNNKKSCVENTVRSNEERNRQIPTDVSTWLENVQKIEAEVRGIPDDVNNCFNLKMRYKIGSKAFKTIRKIDTLISENPGTLWIGDRIPLGKVDSKKTSTSTPSGDHNDFKSRQSTFDEVLNALQSDHNTHMIALCGMAGVGKTTMMQNLRRIVEEKKMFDCVVMVTIGVNPNPIKLQDAVADYIMGDDPLTEQSKDARADRLRNRFETASEGGKKKFLVLLDDVWQSVDLNDIGLGHLPNQGVGFKFLLTSRDRNVCTEMGVKANSIFKVGGLEELEAQGFFFQEVRISDDAGPDIRKIGEEIVRRCNGLPIAIKTIASNLRYKDKHAWETALDHLEHHKQHFVDGIFQMSYNNIKEEETKQIFLLCGLFPDDFDIPIEELLRYGWGLKLLEVERLKEARRWMNTCVDELVHANLLIKSDRAGCVKMHDLVLDFVLRRISKGDHAWIINHGDMSNWSRGDMSESCKRISLTCMGMSAFPRDFKYPNLSLLRLMHGDKFLKFPEGFYEEMVKLQVIAYEKMQYPLLPRSLQCSTNLRTLCLHQCLLMFDCSPIGDLLNLEVLSLAHCSIRKLPSTFGNLKKLKLLDLTGCVDLRIDDGVLKNLVNLEELYMRVANEKAISFTDGNYNELVACSKNLSALEIEFFEKNAQLKNMSFKKLERFKISMGCYLTGSLDQKKEIVKNMIYFEINMDKYRHSFGNTLMLVTNKEELMESGMNLLFEKTEVLYLEMDDVNNLKDVFVEPPHPPQHSFYNLRVLDVFNCADLRYLFTVQVASGLAKLEWLSISLCPVMEVLVYAYGDNNGAGAIKFQELKFLYLVMLPKLVSLCNIDSVIELPQLVELRLDGLPNFTSIYLENKSARSSMSNNSSAMQPLLNKKVVIPKLEKLKISSMENLKQIWPCQITACEEVNISMLREIGVKQCDSLVNLFPSNPLPLLNHLEELKVEKCGSIEVLFNIDLGCVPEIEEDSCRLRYITVWELGKLRELWRMKGVNNSDILIRSFQAVESITIRSCKRFRNIFTPTTTNFDLGALACISIYDVEDFEECGRNNELVESSQEVNVISKEEISKVDDNIPNVAFPSYLLHTFHHLQTLRIKRNNRVEVVFEMESASSGELTTTRNNQLRYLKDLELKNMERMSHVWKCNWNKILISQRQQRESSFHNLTNIGLWHCPNIKYLFSPLMAKLLSNLENVKILFCDGMEEVVSNRDDENEENATSTSSHKNTTFFPHLDILKLRYLPRLKCTDGGGARHSNNKITSNITTTITSIHDQFQCAQVTGASWSLCQYPREISIYNCHALSSVIPSCAIGQMQKLEVLEICYCESMMEVFETQGINNSGGGSSNNVDEGSGGTGTTLTIPRLKNITVLKLPNLKILHISSCDRLEHIFMFSTLESLKQLKELKVEKCKAMQVIVKEENNREHTTTSKSVDFPRLESLELVNLPNLKGFFLGMNDFQWELLDKVKIFDCPQMMVFTSGQSTARKLNWIHTSLGKHSLECGLNFHGTTNLHQTPLTSLDITSSCPTTLKEIPWSFHNLIEIDVSGSYHAKKIIPSNELLQRQKLEKIHVKCCYGLKKGFKVKGTHSGFNGSESVVKFPKLIEVELCYLPKLKYIWKSNQWTVLEFPNLTRVSIQDQCNNLKHVFSCSMVGSLLKLQELHISGCKNMEVIVKEANVVLEEEEEEEESGAKVNEMVLPSLKSLKLDELPSLKGFCLGKEAFSWPSLDTLEITGCPAITVFTKGHLATPELKVIDTSFGMCYVREDLNSFIKTKQQEGFEF